MAKVMENCFQQNFENKFFKSFSTNLVQSKSNVFFLGSEGEYFTRIESCGITLFFVRTLSVIVSPPARNEYLISSPSPATIRLSMMPALVSRMPELQAASAARTSMEKIRFIRQSYKRKKDSEESFFGKLVVKRPFSPFFFLSG